MDLEQARKGVEEQIAKIETLVAEARVCGRRANRAIIASVELLRSVHTWFMQKCPGEYNGCGLWIDVDDLLSEHPRQNCILDVDNHCHPNHKEEYQQCGCANCRAALAKVKEGQ